MASVAQVFISSSPSPFPHTFSSSYNKKILVATTRCMDSCPQHYWWSLLHQDWQLYLTQIQLGITSYFMFSRLIQSENSAPSYLYCINSYSLFHQTLTFSRSITELNQLQTRLKSYHFVHVWHLCLRIKMHRNFLLYTVYSYLYSYSIWAKNNRKEGYPISVQSCHLSGFWPQGKTLVQSCSTQRFMLLVNWLAVCPLLMSFFYWLTLDFWQIMNNLFITTLERRS